LITINYLRILPRYAPFRYFSPLFLPYPGPGSVARGTEGRKKYTFDARGPRQSNAPRADGARGNKDSQLNIRPPAFPPFFTPSASPKVGWCNEFLIAIDWYKNGLRIGRSFMHSQNLTQFFFIAGYLLTLRASLILRGPTHCVGLDAGRMRPASAGSL